MDYGPWTNMNFLAHAYLSFNDPDILIGNMISDFVKGRKQYDYPSMVRKGIVLHRSIDSFTDAHPCTHEMKKFFNHAYGLYAGPFTDIVYDYFLANDRQIFPSDKALEDFTLRSYTHLQQNSDLLPLTFSNIFPYMRNQNWLYNYRTEAGIMKSFSGLVYRAKYMSESVTASSIFINNRIDMEPFYREFFPLLKIHANYTLQELLNSD